MTSRIGPPDAQLQDAGRPDVAFDSGIVRDGGSDRGVSDAELTDVSHPYCANGPCDPRAQTGCGSSLFCVATSNGAVCAATIGRHVEGDACASAFDCAAGLLCADENGRGVCREVCCAGMECGAGRGCTGLGVIVSGRASGYRTCEQVRICSPFAVADCQLGTACYLATTQGDFACAVTGTRAAGETCNNSNDCLAQHVCVGIGVQRCAALCDISASPSCSQGARCQSQAYLPMHIGVCVSSM